jgi:lysophospholipase
MGGAVMLRLAHAGSRWFDRFVLSAPMVDLPGRLTAWPSRVALRLLRLFGSGGAYVPGGTSSVGGCEPFAGNPLTGDPLRYARNAAIIAEQPALGLGAPTVAWADTAFRAMREFADPAYAARIRQPVLIIAAGADTVVSTPAIERFAIHLRAGAHLVIPGARHELLQEQDRIRAQFWAAFDAFVPGTPPFG